MKEKRYQNGGVKITPSRENLERVYNVCNKLFADRKDEEIFYQLGECKRRNMKAV